MNFIWRVWKTKMHDKMTINVDHYDTNLFAIIFVIEWIVNEIDNHIQSIRDIDIKYFKNWTIMLKYIIIVFENSNFKRNMRNEFRTLIMNIQDFQSFYFIFFRFNDSIDYNEIIKIEKLMNKIFWNLKKAMNFWFREFIIFDEIRIILQQIYNRQTSFKKRENRRTSTTFEIILFQVHFRCFDFDIVHEICYVDFFREVCNSFSLWCRYEISWFVKNTIFANVFDKCCNQSSIVWIDQLKLTSWHSHTFCVSTACMLQKERNFKTMNNNYS